MPKQTVAEFFDAYASGFDAIYGNRNTPLNRLANRLLRKSMRLRFEKTVEGCQPIEGSSILDIGCGGGHYAVYLARLGATRVVGIDFAEGMLELAHKKARDFGVEGQCEFIHADFDTHHFERQFDYSIAMGFMDYVPDPARVIARALSLSRRRAFFSFPRSRGVLAWQRRLRYRRKCDLYMYDREELVKLFDESECRTANIERIARDYFVTAHVC